MGKGLIVMAVAVHGPLVVLVGIMGIHIGPDAVVLYAEVEVGNSDGIHVIEAKLVGEFIGGVAIACAEVGDTELIEGKLSVELHAFEREVVDVEANHHLVCITTLVFDGTVEDNGIEVVNIKAATVFVVVVEGYGFKETDVEVFEQVDAEVVHGDVFGRVWSAVGIASDISIAVGELHKEVLVVESPDFGVDFQEEVIGSEIGEQQGAYAVANKVTVLSELYADGFHGAEGEVAACLEEVDAAIFEAFGEVCAGICSPGVSEGHLVGCYTHLIFGNEAVETDLAGDVSSYFDGAGVGIEGFV